MKAIAAGVLALLVLAGCGQSFTVSFPDAPAPSVPRGYERLYSPAPWAFRFSEAGEPVRRGARAERFELRAGDCGGSDCGQPRARAQIAQAPESSRARLDRDAWFGWSFLNATIPPAARDRWLGTVVGEWKLRGEDPAVFRLIQVPAEELGFDACAPNVCTRAGAATDDVVVELDAAARAYGWGDAQNDGRVCRLWNMAAQQGRWVDVVVNTNFGTDAYGYLRVWVNGELRCNYMGPLVPPAMAGAVPTNRRGVFNSFTRRWDEAHGAEPKPTLVAFYDEFLAGQSRAEVDTRLREAAGARPVD